MKRILFLLYGVISYVIFLVAFLYLVGFVSGIIVPKHIDSTPVAHLAMALLINAALLTLFGLQHSAMARPAFKRWWTQFVPQPIERSTYVLLSSLCLILLFWKWQPLGGIIWQVESGVAQLILRIGSLTGFLIVLLATFQINHFDLFGLRQVWIYFRRKPYTNVTFRTPLFYKYVRHPLYFGFLLAFWSTPVMTIAHLFFAVMTTGYILVAIQLEERDLINEFGESYLSYKRKLPMIIPFTKFKKSTGEIPNVQVEVKKDN
jgi:methanethiol S-methyltransferase